MRLSLHARLTTVIVGLIALLIFGLAAILAAQFAMTLQQTHEAYHRATTTVLTEEVKVQGAATTRLLANLLLRPLAAGDDAAITEVIQAALAHADVSNIQIFDAAGRLVHEGRPSADAARPAESADETLRMTAGEIRIWMTPRALYFATPIVVGPQVIGGIHLESPIDQLLTDVAVTRRRLEDANQQGTSEFLGAVALVTAILLALGVIGSGLAARRITRPIMALAEMTRRLGRGEAVASIPTGPPDEIGELGAALKFLVDKRSKAEEELRRSEQQFRGAFESAAHGMAIGTGPGLYLKVNKRLCEIVGYDESELLAMNYADVTHPEDTAAQADLTAKLVAGEIDSFILEKRYVHKSGSVVWALLSSWAVRDRHGQPLHVVGEIQDITARKQAEAVLRESEERFRTIAEAIPVPLAISRFPDGKILYANKAMTEMTGVPNERIVGQNAARFYDRLEDRAAVLENLKRTGRVAGREVHFTTPDGIPVVLTMTMNMTRFQGNPAIIVGFVDTTERKRVEEALRVSEQRFRDVAEVSYDGFWEIDENYRFTYVSDQWRSLDHDGGDLVTRTLGRTRWEVAGADPDRDDLWRRHRDDLVARRPFRNFEYARQNPDGSIRHISISGKPIFDAAGTFKGYRGSRTDITERKRAEETARALETELAHAQRLGSLGEMATSLAHEINQPLAAIASYVQGSVRHLRAGTTNLNEVLEALDKAAAQALRAGGIVHGMLGYVRREAPERTPVDINAAIGDAIPLLQGEARAGRIDVTLALAEALPPAEADRVQTQQVVVNLARNAIEAMRDGARDNRALTIFTRRNGDDLIEIGVRDSGPGIPAAIRDRIFSPLFTTKAGGVGMGLPICQSIVEAHGGRLWLVASTEHGSEFRFTLPLAGRRRDGSAKADSGLPPKAGGNQAS